MFLSWASSWATNSCLRIWHLRAACSCWANSARKRIAWPSDRFDRPLFSDTVSSGIIAGLTPGRVGGGSAAAALMELILDSEVVFPDEVPLSGALLLSCTPPHICCATSGGSATRAGAVRRSTSRAGAATLRPDGYVRAFLCSYISTRCRTLHGPAG